MSRSALWLLSLLAFAVLCVVCVRLHASSIQSELETRTLAALQASEYRDAAEVTFSGRDAIVSAENLAVAEQVADEVRRVEGVRMVRAQELAPLAEVEMDGPFALMPLENRSLALRGAVPDSATRDRLLGAARMAFPGRILRDGLTLDSTASGDWAEDVAASFSRLKAVQNPGLAVGPDGTFALSGTVDGEGMRTNVESRIAEVITPREIDNRLTLTGAPEPTTAAPSDTAAATPEASGETADPEPAAQGPTPEAASGASTPTASGEVEVQNALARDADAQTLERALRQRLGRGTVTFEAGTDRLTDGSAQVLRRAAEALKAHPEIAIELQAHTDSEGPTRTNQRLSEARARAAKRVLVASGVTPAQLLAAGYGESTAIASNATEAGRAQNRRVVFKLLRRR